VKDYRKSILSKIYLVYFFTIVFTLVIIGKIIHIQYFEGEIWRRISKKRNYRYSDIKAIRGNIFSADGKQLVLSKPVYTVYMDPNADYLKVHKDFFDKNIEPLADSLKKHFGIDKNKFLNDINFYRLPKNEKKRAYLIIKDIELDKMELMNTFPIFNLGQIKGGFVTEEKYVSDYPYGTLAKRTLGIAEGKKFGLNWYYDKELSGTVGKQYEQKMKGGQWLPVNSDSIGRIEPQNGYDIITTIDFKLQDFAETELAKKIKEHKANWGCIVLMEVETGHIKAIANLTHDTATGDVFEDNNYAVSHLIEPGSTFKLATLMTAFEDGYINIDDTIDCEGGKIELYGKPFTDSRKWGYGKINVRDIFKVSSNIGVVKIVEKFYNCKNQGETSKERADKRKKFLDGLIDMRLNQKVNTEIENEPRPRIEKLNLSHISLLKMAYGYELQLTPLQILTFYNAVANNGRMMKPMFVSDIKEGDRVIRNIEPTVLKEKIASDKTIAFAHDILEAVVKDGTASSINNTKYYQIAGKTGTSKIYHPIEKYEHSTYYISSFAGYFPTDKPKYSCIVVIYEPKQSGFYGAVVSAPVFKSISDKVYTTELAVFTEQDIVYTPDNMPPLKKGLQKDIEKIYNKFGTHTITENPASEWCLIKENDRLIELASNEITDSVIPNVVDMSLRDAIYMLENMGFVVKFNGTGRIISQIPDAGQHYKKGDIVNLILAK